MALEAMKDPCRSLREKRKGVALLAPTTHPPKIIERAKKNVFTSSQNDCGPSLPVHNREACKKKQKEIIVPTEGLEPSPQVKSLALYQLS